MSGTNSGAVYAPPQLKEIELELDIDALLSGKFHRLSHVNRYSSIPTIRKENVAEHSWYVAFYSYLLAKDLERRYKDEELEIDYGKLLGRALLHDLDESLTGDFLRIIKYGHPDLKKALDEVSVSMMIHMTKEVGVNLLPDWKSAKDDDLEGHIVQVVDLARVVSYIWEEIKLGNEHIRPLLDEVCEYFETYCVTNEDTKVAPYARRMADWVREHRNA